MTLFLVLCQVYWLLTLDLVLCKPDCIRERGEKASSYNDCGECRKEQEEIYDGSTKTGIKRIGSVDVHWTTHRPRGLSTKDIAMARHCDNGAGLMGCAEAGQGLKC